MLVPARESRLGYERGFFCVLYHNVGQCWARKSVVSTVAQTGKPAVRTGMIRANDGDGRIVGALFRYGIRACGVPRVPPVRIYGYS